MNLNNIDSNKLRDDLNRSGYALIKDLLSAEECDTLINNYSDATCTVKP